jgi:Na+-driven multidrug efflux pump
MASFYTHEEDVKEVVKILIWLNAAFMPIWAASWVLPAGLKGARDARFAMWVSMLGMWGCRVVAGYTLGVMLGWGVVGVWLGMFLDWAVRGALFYWRMVSGRWLWKYPRKMPDNCAKWRINRQTIGNLHSAFDIMGSIDNMRPVHTIPL